MLLLLSQTITPAKILLTPGNTDRNTDQPVPVWYSNTDTKKVASIKTVYSSCYFLLLFKYNTRQLSRAGSKKQVN